ncbi:MAG: hypothetical protein BGN92_02580 [Sphingobacteriales bacterium 41-5]|nr:MAG: hypothetical protein BGN92_02580 [Sphingobacteriales bacterium 41-5]
MREFIIVFLLNPIKVSLKRQNQSVEMFVLSGLMLVGVWNGYFKGYFLFCIKSSQLVYFCEVF